MNTYPEVAGFKELTTSAEAAATVDVNRLRRLVMRTLSIFGPLTADEVAEKVAMDVLTIRPRLSELRRLGMIMPSGERRQNRSGKSAIVWQPKISERIPTQIV